MQIDWKWVAFVLLTLGLAAIGYLNNRLRTASRVDELKDRVSAQQALLNEKFHSDLNKFLHDAEIIRKAAQVRGKELSILDIAMWLQHRRLEREKQTQEKKQ